MTPITAFNRLLTAGERSDLAPKSKALETLFEQAKAFDIDRLKGAEVTVQLKKPRSHKEQLERLIELITEKRTPRLKGRIRVEIVTSTLNYAVRRNGAAIVIRTSVLPNDKRFPEVLQRFSIAARRLLNARPFDIPAPKMTPDEHRGWQGLINLGARVSRGGTALDLRSILPKDCGDLARLLHHWQLVCSGSANVPIRNRVGDPIGVYTKERLS